MPTIIRVVIIVRIIVMAVIWIVIIIPVRIRIPGTIWAVVIREIVRVRIPVCKRITVIKIQV
jgi:hypothetical protein